MPVSDIFDKGGFERAHIAIRLSWVYATRQEKELSVRPTAVVSAQRSAQEATTRIIRRKDGLR